MATLKSRFDTMSFNCDSNSAIYDDFNLIDVNNCLDSILMALNEKPRVLLDEGVMQTLSSQYLCDMWRGEFPEAALIDNNIGEICDLLFEMPPCTSAELKVQLEKHHVKNPSKLASKLLNIKDAMQLMLIYGDDETKTLSINTIKQLHEIVGKDVIDDAGQFRTKQVCAARSFVVYAPHGQIERRLKELVQFVNEQLSVINNIVENKDRLRKIILLGSLFFSEFLLIHPFKNGNGRTARLLLNYIMQAHVFVPFSLWYKTRDLYIKVLEERNHHTRVPNALALYILFCIKHSTADIDYLLLE